MVTGFLCVYVMSQYDPTLAEDEKEDLEYIAGKYGNVELAFDLEGKTGAIYKAPLFPSAMMGDIQENGYAIDEVREREGDMEISVVPNRNAHWADTHESPLGSKDY